MAEYEDELAPIGCVIYVFIVVIVLAVGGFIIAFDLRDRIRTLERAVLSVRSDN